jgi:hypothetical protein
MVNEPFDFVQALGLGAIGAGLAAATRQKNNHERAESLGTSTLSPEVEGYVDALRACGIHRWVLAWARGDKAETRVVTERYDERSARIETRVHVLPGDVAFDAATWMLPADAGEPLARRSAPEQAAPPAP